MSNFSYPESNSSVEYEGRTTSKTNEVRQDLIRFDTNRKCGKSRNCILGQTISTLLG